MSGLILKTLYILFLSGLLHGFSKAEAQVSVSENQLVVDGVKQPQLFGAEVQYFRLRGGYGPNIPRAEVIALWNKALDRLVEAKMNAVSFYIPWDFHEYAEGKFDFTGTADIDGDGKPDYPSRDLVTFFKLIANHGITRIMVRPGPYINAEWGFLGFGAIPSWFHNKYPDSHMRTPYGQRSRLYDYHNADLLRETALWFKELNKQVLNQQMGPGKPVIFLQLDNETNYQWQSIYNHDFGLSAIQRYQSFLQSLYVDINGVNQAHGRQWDRLSQIQPPTYQGRNIAEDQDWYKFADFSIYSYLNKIRKMWFQEGVDEPRVLFTLAESYNATRNGLLPNFVLRNARNITGLMTVNLYPKTDEAMEHPLLNFPFKADLDVKSADAANDSYFNSRQEWVMGPEIQGGWWRGTNVSPEARQQTYLTVIGHGLKAFFIYYFNEGQNWDLEWSYDQIKPLFTALLQERRLENVAVNLLPEDFWNELQARSDRKILVGFDVRTIMKLGRDQNKELFFDSPLDGGAHPRNHYFQLKQIGEKIISPYQDFLARSLEVHDEVALVKDSTSHQPVADQNIQSVQAEADWTGGLLGYLMNSDINPRILHGDLSADADFNAAKILVHLDTGLNSPRTLELLKKEDQQGKTIINFLAGDVARNLGIEVPASILLVRGQPMPASKLVFYLDGKGQLRPANEANTTRVELSSSNPVYSYTAESLKNNNCEGVLYWQDKIVGYRCQRTGGVFVQIGALLFEDYNSDSYAKLSEAFEHKLFLKSIFRQADLKPKLELSKNALQTVAFARKDPEKKLLWITVKTGTLNSQSFEIKPSTELLQLALPQEKLFFITDLLSNNSRSMTGLELSQKGFPVTLGPNGSTVFVVAPVRSKILDTGNKK